MSNIKQVIVVRKDLKMRTGKIAAQVAHASMKFLVDGYDRSGNLHVALSPVQDNWVLDQFTKIVVSVDTEEELLDLIEKAKYAGVDCRHIIDSGRTEFNGVHTLTVAAFGPDESEKLDPITGQLKLL